jgi:hypothetical protein
MNDSSHSPDLIRCVRVIGVRITPMTPQNVSSCSGFASSFFAVVR